MKYSCPIYPALRNANAEIQMICVRTPNSLAKGSKAARGLHQRKKEGFTRLRRSPSALTSQAD